MFGIGHFPELIIVLVIALIVFGPGKLPEIGRSLGKGIRGFREATSELERTLAGTFEDPLPPPTASAPPVVQAQSDTALTSSPHTGEPAPLESIAPPQTGTAGGADVHPETPTAHLDHPAPVTHSSTSPVTDSSAERSSVVGIAAGSVLEATSPEAPSNSTTQEPGAATSPHPRLGRRSTVEAADTPAGGHTSSSDVVPTGAASSVPPATHA